MAKKEQQAVQAPQEVEEKVGRFHFFTKWFGLKYTFYWGIAFAIVIILMTFSYLNNHNIKGYEVTFYNADGTVQSVKYVENNMDLIMLQKDNTQLRSVRPIKWFSSKPKSKE